MPEKISLKTNTVNQLLAYLGTQPYQSVAGLIQAIQSEAQGQVTQAEAPVAEAE